jgi:pimeloyl-ACP methyl ester carboxylesterase
MKSQELGTVTEQEPQQAPPQEQQDAPPAPPRRRRRWRAAVAVAAVLALIGWLALRDTTPVGHFTSAAGKDRFVAAYERAMAQLPRPDATLDVRTTFGVVRLYRFTGADPQQPPLVLLPGRAAASPLWADNLPSLRQLRTVYTVDLLGEPGASVQDRPIESDEDQAQWLTQVLQQLPEPQVHLVGWSIGGWTALNTAVRRPAKIAGVVLIDPAATFADLPLELIVRSLPASVRWLPKRFRDDFNSWTAGGAPVRDEPVADMIEAGMQHYALDLPTPARFGAAQLQALDARVLVILAGASVMHDAAEAKRYAEANLRHRTVLLYEGASHAVNGEQPDRIAADIAAFLG